MLFNEHTPVFFKLISIVINNALPCVDFFSSGTKDPKNTMIMLSDSGAATNTGNTSYHRWIMTLWLDIVVKYIECGSNSKWDSLNFEVAIDNEVTGDNHGATTALI